MFLVRLAFRNLTRQLRRNLLSMGAVIAGVWVMIIGSAFIQGVRENIIRAQVDTVSGHILARPADYPTTGLSHPVDELLTLPPEAETWLDEHATAWTTRTLFTPRVVAGVDSIRSRAFAIDPERDPAVFPRHTWNHTGTIPRTAEDGVLLSQGLGQLLDRTTGDTVVLEARTHKGAVNALQVPVAGLVTISNPMFDSNGMMLPQALADELLQIDGRFSHLATRVGDRDRAEDLAPGLDAAMGEQAEVVTWVDETAELLRLQDIRQQALNILVFALLGMSAAGIANTILMAAYERVREIGTLRAMGMTRADVLKLFVIEGAMIGVVGALLGAMLGGGMSWYWSVNPIDLTAQMDRMGTNLPISTLLYTRFDPPQIGLSIAFGIAVAMVASVYPARLASNLQPADAVRG